MKIVNDTLLKMLLLLIVSGGLVACSESNDDSDGEEFANWQACNELYFASLEDSLAHGGKVWKKLKTYTKDENSQGKQTDYVYVKVLEAGIGTTSPLYSDSVRIAYRGRLIPSVTYPEGFVFDQTYTGLFDLQTTAVVDNVVSGFVDGFTTALQHMHKGDRWRVYIPHTLGYGTVSNKSIPAYSVLVFDLALIDIASGKEQFVPWSSRRF